MQRLLFWATMVTLLFSACSRTGENNGTVISTETAATVTPATTPVIAATIDFTEPITPTQTDMTLIIWASPQIIARTEAGTDVFSEQRFDFRTTRDDVADIILEQKQVTGQGSILNYLRTGRNVAPTILPDLVALPTDQLVTAVAEELVFPLDAFVGEQAVSDLYPAAQALASVDGQLYGYPFAFTNVAHLAYNRAVLTGTIPTRWDALTQIESSSMVLPASGRGGAILALQFYLSVGGSLRNEAGQPALELEPLTQALTLLNQRQVTEPFFVPQSSNVASFEEAWQLLQNGSATLSHTSSDWYLQGRLANPTLAPASVAGPNGLVTPLVDGWAWVLTSPDPARRAVTAELLKSLIVDVNLGEWSYHNRFLPTTQSALLGWPDDDAYVSFIQYELERAQPYPVAVDSTIMMVLRTAVFDVVSATKTPVIAAEEAVAVLQS